MNAVQFELFKAGLAAILSGYLFRYLWPVLARPLLRRHGPALLARIGGATGADPFAALPAPGSPYRPHYARHELAVPLLFCFGCCIGAALQVGGAGAMDMLTDVLALYLLIRWSLHLGETLLAASTGKRGALPPLPTLAAMAADLSDWMQYRLIVLAVWFVGGMP